MKLSYPVESTLPRKKTVVVTMELEDCFSFADEMFDDVQQEAVHDKVLFEARNEDPAWFMDEALQESFQNCKDEVAIIKYTADYQYLKGELLQAVENYEKMIEILPKNNVVTRRECYENITRCAIKLDKFCVGLRYSILLQDSSKTIEQLTVSLSCIIDTNLSCGLYSTAVLYCMKLIRIHRLNSHVWQRLAFALACDRLISVPNTAGLQKMQFRKHRAVCDCQKPDCLIALENAQLGNYQNSIDKCSQDPTNSRDVSLPIVVEKKRDLLIVLFCIMMSKYILNSIKGTAVGFSAQTIMLQIELLDKDVALLKRTLDSGTLDALHLIVTKNVFGFSNEDKRDHVDTEEFVDQGSCKFQPIDIEVSVPIVLGVTWDTFYEDWFNAVCNLSK